MIVFLLLLVWFFFVKVSIFISSSDVELVGNGIIQARFQEMDLEKLSSGQEAITRIENSEEGGTTLLDSLVVDVQQEQSIVDLVVLEENSYVYSAENPGKIVVEIIVEKTTPFQLLNSSIREYLESNN
jgi:hypothetical protein